MAWPGILEISIVLANITQQLFIARGSIVKRDVQWTHNNNNNSNQPKKEKIISIQNHRQKEIGEIKTTSQMRARTELWQTHQNGRLLLCAWNKKRHVNAASREPSDLSLRANDWWQQRAPQVNVPLGRQKDVAAFLLHKTWKQFSLDGTVLVSFGDGFV